MTTPEIIYKMDNDWRTRRLSFSDYVNDFIVTSEYVVRNTQRWIELGLDQALLAHSYTTSVRDVHIERRGR